MLRSVAFFMRGGVRSVKGGHKVLLTYANLLASRALEVTVFFPALNSQNGRGLARIARLARYVAGVFVPSIYQPSGWLQLHERVHARWIPWARRELATEFDVSVIADHAVGADVTSGHASGVGGVRPKTVYLFQEYEYYMAGGELTRGAIERMVRCADAVVAISPVIHELCMRLTEPGRVHLVNNGIDFAEFFVREPVGSARRVGIGFAFRQEEFKRTRDIVAALTALRLQDRLSGVTCWAYGSVKDPGLPAWIEYHRAPTSRELCDLLNRSSVFVVASAYEGWGLPGAEAMACGAALVTTRNGGCEAYARHLENALLCSPGSVPELAAAIGRLLAEPALAQRLSASGSASIRRFTWEAAGTRFLEVLERTAAARAGAEGVHG